MKRKGWPQCRRERAVGKYARAPITKRERNRAVSPEHQIVKRGIECQRSKGSSSRVKRKKREKEPIPPLPLLLPHPCYKHLLIFLPPTSYLPSLHLLHFFMFLDVLLHFLLPLLLLNHSEFFNEMPEIFESEALNFSTVDLIRFTFMYHL